MAVRAHFRSLVVLAAFAAGASCGALGLRPTHAQEKEEPDPGATRVRALPPLTWERLNSRGGAGRTFVFRTPVPGGWLVMARTAPFGGRGRNAQGQGQGRRPRPDAPGDEGGEQQQQQERPGRGGGRGAADAGVSITFLPDPGHAWNGGSQ
jgi:hypothetical protein